MDYRKFLGKTETLVLPYLGGTSVASGDRRFRLAGEPPAPGWWRFDVSGRQARAVERAEPADLEHAPAVRGHLVRVGPGPEALRLVHAGAAAEPVALLPDEEPPALAPAVARRWGSGDLLFDRLDFEGEAEETARLALEERGALAGQKGVAASLRAAFGYATLARAAAALGIPFSPAEVGAEVARVAEGGTAAAEALLRRLAAERAAFVAELAYRARAEAMRAAGGRAVAPPVTDALRAPPRHLGHRRGRATEGDAPERAEAALEAAGARLLATRALAGGNLEVTFGFRGERFITVVDAVTLQVLDAGICLAGADREVTLESLPSVVREAIDEGKLVITRR